MNPYQIIFFDGICVFCNRMLQFIMKHDKKNIFKFASLQSGFAGKFFSEKNYPLKNTTIILWNGKKFYEKSSASLRICKQLNFPYSLAVIFFIIPQFIRNIFYDVIARNRYAWFGKTDNCIIPAQKDKDKFIG